MGFTLPTAPAPDACACGAQALHDWDGNMSWPDRVYISCPKCKKQGPKVTNVGLRKWPVAAEKMAVKLWNEQQAADRAAQQDEGIDEEGFAHDLGACGGDCPRCQQERSERRDERLAEFGDPDYPGETVDVP